MLNILFIGNSFTFVNDLPKMLETVAADAGVKIAASSVLKGGAYLHQFADPEHELGKRLAETYPTKNWDFIVLQDQSFNPARDPEDFLTSAEKLCKTMNGGAKFLFYSTWAYRDNTDKLATTDMTYTEMLTALTASYQKAADLLGGIRVPVGNAFAASTAAHPEIDLYTPDDYHPSPCGTYLAACLFYQAVTGNSSAALPTPDGATAEQGEKLRKIAVQF